MFSIKIIATMTTGIPQQLQPKRESICLLAISNNNTMPDTRNSNTKKGKQVYHILYNTLKAVNTSTLYPLCETHGEKVSSCVLHYPDPVSFATTQIKYILSARIIQGKTKETLATAIIDFFSRLQCNLHICARSYCSDVIGRLVLLLVNTSGLRTVF